MKTTIKQNGTVIILYQYFIVLATLLLIMDGKADVIFVSPRNEDWKNVLLELNVEKMDVH